MASFNDILEAQTVSGSGATCLTGQWRLTLNPEDRAQFDAACADASIQAVKIFKTARAMGYPGGDTAFLRHRRGGCRCDVR